MYLTKFAEHLAHWAELRGLAFAIGDEQLLDLVNQGLPARSVRTDDPERDRERDEMDARGIFQQIHTRVAHLLKLATDKQTRRKQRKKWWARLKK